MDWELATLQPDFLALFWAFFRTPAERHDNEVIQHSLERCERHFRQFNSRLSQNTYLAGETFTMGDISCAVSLYRYFETGLQVPRFPNVMTWYDRLLERPAYKEHIAVPFNELKGRLEY
jgi:glutathione S-transferase